jgi:hypothetical protein
VSLGTIEFSPTFRSFLERSDVVVEPTVVSGGTAMRRLRWRDRVATVARIDSVFTLDWGTNSGVLTKTDLHTIEKVLVMEVGPGVRHMIGLPPEGFLPNIFTLAPGFSWESTGHGMELSWHEDGVRHGLMGEASRAVATLPTYRSQYLRHSLDAIIESFLLEGRGIFTEDVADAPRPFALPARTHEWLTGYIDGYWATTQCVFYDNHDAGLRFVVSDGGYRVDRRPERQYVFSLFEIWTPSMDVLQVWATWVARSAWSPLSKQRRFVRVPDESECAAGYAVEPVSAPSRYEGALQLVKDGTVHAIMGSGQSGHANAVVLSHLLSIGIDLLEISILDSDGEPALVPNTPAQ